MELIRPERTAGGRRVYTVEQVERLKYVQRLRAEKRLNVDAIRQLVGTTDALRPSNGHTAAGGTSIARRLRQLRREQKMTLSEAATRKPLEH